MKACKLLFLLIVAPFFIQAQVFDPKIIPPSPDAFSLAKFGQLPVSTFTGIPNISIPIFELKERNISVPVSLSYNSSGIKVDEVASWVGLGWALNAGGTITRVVHGKAEHLLSNGSIAPSRFSTDFYDYATNHTSTMDFVADSDLDAASNGGLDTEPDIYYYNFAGKSGKFYFDNDGKAFFEKEEGIKIELQFESIYGYNIIATLDNGDVYTFAAKEYTFYGGENDYVISGWLLSKIKSPQGSEINFEYQSFGTVSHDVRLIAEYVLDQRPSNPQITPSQLPTMGVNYQELKLKKIKGSNGFIEFVADNSIGRKDCRPSTYPLKEIILFRSDSTIVSRYRLYTSYFEANDLSKYDGPSPTAFQHLNFRLRLDSIKQQSNSTDFTPPYKFIYWGDDNPTTYDPYTLPYRLSPSQDHWGYYNHSANTHIFPTSGWDGYLTEDYSDKWYYTFYTGSSSGWAETGNSPTNGANRESDTAATKAGCLSEIYYPTGGKTKFVFELNDYSTEGGVYKGAGLRIKKLIDYDAEGGSIETDYTYLSSFTTLEPWTYYKRLTVKNSPGSGTTPGASILTLYGLPLDAGYDITTVTHFLKITAFPQAVLGSHSEIGYAKVTVSQSGNGRTVYDYGNSFEYGDDIRVDSEAVQLRNLYRSQYLLGYTYSGYPLGYSDERSLKYNDWPYPEYFTNSWKRGHLKRKQFFSENNVLLSQEEYEYYRKTFNTIPGYKVIKLNANGDFIFSKYYLPCGWVQQKKITSYNYDINGGNPVITSTEFFYDNPTHLQPTRIIRTNSKAEKETTNIKYSLDYTITGTINNGVGQGIKDLQDNHILSSVVEKFIQKSNLDGSNLRTTSAVLTTFKPTVLLPDIIFNWEPLPGNMNFTPTTITETTVTKSSDYQSRSILNDYDSYGNLLEHQNTNDVKYNYLWSYQSSFPAAKVTNASYSDIAYTSFEADGKGNWSYSGTPVTEPFAPTGKKVYNLSSGSITKSINSATTYIISYWRPVSLSSLSIGGTMSGYPISGRTVNGWKYYEHKISAQSAATISGSGSVDELRLYPAVALMTTYTYEPLIGMTSQCDVNNRITYYEYDGFGRLILVRDQDKNILKQLCYNYAGQQQDCNALYAPAAPPAPGNLTAVINTGSAVDLSWVNNAVNATVNEVYRSAGDATHYTLLVTLPDNVSTYTDTQTDINTLYFYKIKTAGNGGNSGYSNEKGITTPGVSPSALSNTAPVINDIADIYVRSGSSKIVNIAATDDAGDILGFVVTGLPAFAAFSENGNGTGAFHLSPISTAPGNFSATVKAIDNYGAFSQKVINIIVIDKDIATYHVNFNNIDYPLTDPLWNSFNSTKTGGVQVLANTTLYALKDETGTASSLSVKLLNSWPQNYLGVVTGNDSGVYPDAVIATGYYFYVQASAPQKTIKIAGLKADKKYDLTFYGNRSFASDQITNYTVGAQTVTLNSRNNISNTVQITGLAANGQGEIDIVVDAAMTKYALINAMVIKEYPNN